MFNEREPYGLSQNEHSLTLDHLIQIKFEFREFIHSGTSPVSLPPNSPGMHISTLVIFSSLTSNITKASSALNPSINPRVM